MKLGLIGRTDSRGLAWQTFEFWKHMQPDRVLAVQMNEPGWREDLGRFGRNGVTFVDSNLSPNLNKRTLNESQCRRFLEGLDIVFAVETVYDWRFIDWAHDEDVKVVIAANPEFVAHHNNPDWPHPDQWVFPTPWLIDELSELGYGDEILPVPSTEREQTAADPEDDRLKILHVVGKAAAMDRAGTVEFLEAVATIRQPAKVTIITQEDTLPRNIRSHRTIDVEVITGGIPDRWDLYADQHILVQARKYGGLNLPAIEAMSCGLAVLLPECSPNEIWPGPRIKARKGRAFRTPFGRIPVFSVHPIDIAQELDKLARNRDRLALHMSDAAQWAAWNEWSELKDRRYIPLLEEVASL